jgi:murein DD-endopeptidase MepM/ murein hydrolase activator NlpD
MRVALAALVVTLLLGIPVQQVRATDCTGYSAAECAAQQLLDSIRSQLKASLADALAIQQELAFSLEDNRAQQDDLRGQIAASEARLAELDAELVRLQGEIDATNKKIDRERSELSALARAVWAEPDSFLLLAARAKDLGEVFTRTSDLLAAGVRGRALKAALEQDLEKLRADLDRQQQARDEEATLKDALVAKAERLAQVANIGAQIGMQLDAAISQVQAELDSLDGQSPELASQIQAQLLAATASVVAAAQGMVWAQVMIWQQLNLAPAPAHANPQSNEFRLAWPVARPRITQIFGPSTLVLEPPYGGYPHFHTGIDLGDYTGTPILAARDGVVGLAGWNPGGYGNYVIVVHDQGYATLYGHLQRSIVRAGDVVNAGQQIGLMGSTGLSTGSHLHFELRQSGQPKDPSLFLPPLG